MDIIRNRVTKFTKLPILAVLALMGVAAGIGYAAVAATPEAEAQTTATAPQVASIQLWHNDPGKWTYRPGDVATIRVATDIPLASRVVTPDLWRDNWIKAYNGDRHIRFNLARIVGSDLYYQRTITADDVNFAPSGFVTFGKYSTTPQGPVAGGQAASGICSQAAGPDCPSEAQFGWKLKNTQQETNLGKVASKYLQISNTAPNFTLASDKGIQLLVDPQLPHRYLEANESVSLQVQISGTNLYPRQHITPAMADANYVTLTVGKNAAAKAKLSAIGNNITGGYLVYTYLTQASDYAGYGANDFIKGVTLNAASQAASNGICAQSDGATCAGDYQLHIARILPADGIARGTQLVQIITPMDYTVSFPDDMPTSIDIASHTPYTAANGTELPLAAVNHGALTYTLHDYDASQASYPEGMKLVQKADKLVFTGSTNAAQTFVNHYRFVVRATAQDGVTKATSEPIDLRIVARASPALAADIPANITVYQDWFRTGDNYVFPGATALTGETVTYDLVKWQDAEGEVGGFKVEHHSNLSWNQDTRTLSHADPTGVDATKLLPHNTPWQYMLRVHDGKGGWTERKFTITIAERPAVKEVTLNTPADGKYTAGDTIYATASFWDANVAHVNPYSQVNVGLAASAPQPYLNLQIGDHVRQAALVNPSGRAEDAKHQLQFAYTVTEADRDTDGISIAADALQNAASIVGTETGFGNPARGVIPNAFTNNINLRVNGPTYEGVAIPTIKLYRDGYQQSAVLPEPAEAATGATYTLTETDGAAREHVGVLFDSATRTVSIGDGSMPGTNSLTRTTVHQYRLTATDPATNTSVSVTVPIGFASRPEAQAYAIVGPNKPDGHHDRNTYQPGAQIEIRINYNAPIHKPATSLAEDNTLQILVGTETRSAKFLRTDSISAASIYGAGNFNYHSQAVFGYTLLDGDSGQITVPANGLNAPGIIGDATHKANGQNEPVSPKLPPSLNSASFYGKAGTDQGPYDGVNEVSATPSTITYSGVANPVINLYRDGHPDTYGTNVLPAPANATAGMTYTLTKANGDPLPAGLIFNAGSREVSIGAGLKPPKSAQYRITARDASVNADVHLDVTIRYAPRPMPVAYTIAGPRKPVGQHDDNTYQPGDAIEFRINYDHNLAPTDDAARDAAGTARFVKADNNLGITVGTASRTATFTRLDTYMDASHGNMNHANSRQAVFSYTLQNGDTGKVAVANNGLNAPGIIGGGLDKTSTGHGETAGTVLTATMNGNRFHGKYAENGGRAYNGTNNVTAAPALTFTGTTPAVADAVTLYYNRANPYTMPAPQHAVAPIRWTIREKGKATNTAKLTISSKGEINVADTPSAYVDNETFTVTATDHRGLTASIDIQVTTTNEPALTPIRIRSEVANRENDDQDSDGYYTRVGANLIWTVTYPQGFVHPTAGEANAPKLNLMIGRNLREANLWSNGYVNKESGSKEYALRFIYQLQATDMDDQITIADPPLVNADYMSGDKNNRPVIATNNRADAIWDWNPTGHDAKYQVTKVDGGANQATPGPRFPEGTTDITLLQSTAYSDDADKLYLHNSLPQATSPTIANYGPLTYTIKEGHIGTPTRFSSTRNTLWLTVKNGVPTITTGTGGAPPAGNPTVTKTLVATDFRGRTAEHTFKIHHERAIVVAENSFMDQNEKKHLVPYGTNDLIRVFLRHGQELTAAQKTAAAANTARITTGTDRIQPDQTWHAMYNAAESDKTKSVYVYQIQATDLEASAMHISVPNPEQTGSQRNWNEIPVQINPDGPPRWTDAGYGDITCKVTREATSVCLLPLAENGFGELSYQTNDIDTPKGDYGKERLNVPHISDINGITAAVRSDGYAISYGASVAHAQLWFQYRVCDAADVCTNARAATIEQQHRPFVKNAAITAGNANGRYADDTRFLKQGDQVTVTLTFQSAANVDAESDQPYVELNVGDQVRRATPAAARTTQRKAEEHDLVFTYQVQASDYAPNGISVRTGGFRNCAAITGNYGTDRRPAWQNMDLNCDLPAHPADTTPAQGARRDDGKAEHTLDADGNGLIDISNATQMSLIRHDPDGDGQVSAESHGIYFGANAFPDIRQSSDGTTGCPHNACAGYELTANLTLTGNFTPISAWNTVLDGKGHTIAGLNISNGNGTFERTGTASIIRNLGFISPVVNTGEDYGAVIAGYNQGDIANVYIADATLTGDYGLGLIASTHSQGAISNTYATGTVTANSEGSVGSLLGNLQSGTLANSYSRTNIGIADGNVFLGYKVVAGWHGGNGSISNVWEAEADYPHNPLNDFTKSDSDLKAATALTGWDTATWDFGDACQYPALKSGGHRPAEQTARGNACAAR